MTTTTTNKLVASLGDFATVLALFSGIPYDFGALADVLPPEAKKWMLYVSLAVMGISKATHRAIDLLTPAQPVPAPLVAAPIVITK